MSGWSGATVGQEPVLLLLQHLAGAIPLRCGGGGAAMEARSFPELSDGSLLYALLHACAPASFRDFDEVCAATGGGRKNRLVRREHLRTLVADMNAFAVGELHASRDVVGRSEAVVGLISGSAALMGVPVDEDDDDEAERAEALAHLSTLVLTAISLAALSGRVATAMAAAKAALATHNAEYAETIEKTIESFALHFGIQQQQQQQGSSRAAGAAPLPSATPSAAHADPHQRSRSNKSDVGGDGEDALSTDTSYFRNATVQLRRELAEVRARLGDAEAQLKRTKEGEASWERRYRMLLEEQTSSPRSGAGQQGAANGAGSPADSRGASAVFPGPESASREAAFDALAQQVEKQNAMLAAFREATSAQEQGLLVLKRRLKTTEEGLMAKSAERREALERLSIAEDKLTVQVKAKAELEAEVEDLRLQVTVLKLTQRGSDEGDERGMASSFASNGSVDRVLQLENELDESRAQREALQKQLFILQRQMAATVAAGLSGSPTTSAMLSDVGAAATDTLRAQVRSLEKEREQLQRQLATALSRFDELQSTRSLLGAEKSYGASMASPDRSIVGGEGGVATPAAATATAAAAGGAPSTAATTPARLTAEGTSLEGELAAAAGAGTSGAGHDGADTMSLSTEGAGAVEVAATDMLSRLRHLREATRRDNAFRSSLLLQYGHRNLLLQQHHVLLHEDGASARAALACPIHSGGDKPYGGVERGSAGGSILARQRREVEWGLLDSIIHGAGGCDAYNSMSNGTARGRDGAPSLPAEAPAPSRGIAAAVMAAVSR